MEWPILWQNSNKTQLIDWILKVKYLNRKEKPFLHLVQLYYLTFSEHLDPIYHSGLEIKKTTNSTKSGSYLYLFLEIDQERNSFLKLLTNRMTSNFIVQCASEAIVRVFKNRTSTYLDHMSLRKTAGFILWRSFQNWPQE